VLGPDFLTASRTSVTGGRIVVIGVKMSATGSRTAAIESRIAGTGVTRADSATVSRIGATASRIGGIGSRMSATGVKIGWIGDIDVISDTRVRRLSGSGKRESDRGSRAGIRVSAVVLDSRFPIPDSLFPIL
jgi:hypothetical protein